MHREIEGLFRQGRNFLCAQRNVTDSNVINQAGEEGCGCHSLAGADV
jgi:hypothetical protein